MAQAFPIDGLKRAIGYTYLVSYCPPGQIGELKKRAWPLRQGLARQAGMKITDYFAQAIPEVCHRIVAFHQATREPDEGLVRALTETALTADRGSKKVAAFQAQMVEIAALPQRTKPDNRLHRRRGCRLCAAPCSYGYFTLISEPRLDLLQRALEAERDKPPAEQNLLRVLWGFAVSHLARTLGSEQGYTHPVHLGNLAYCLLSLATAKSRYPFPEAPMRALQEANQALIGRLQSS